MKNATEEEFFFPLIEKDVIFYNLTFYFHVVTGGYITTI